MFIVDFRRLNYQRLGIAIFLLSLSFRPILSEATESMRISIPAISGIASPFWMAKEKNFYKDNGFAADIVYIQGAQLTMAALLAGDTDVAVVGGSGPVAAFGAGARDVVVIAGGVNTLVLSLMTRPDISKVSDLRGKTVAVSRFGGNVDYAARLVLQRAGLKPGHDVTLIQAGGVPEVLALMERGTAQAGVMSPPTTTRGRKAGFRELVDIGELGIPYPNTCVAARRSLGGSQPALRAFLKAYIAGIAAFKQEKNLALEVLKKYTKTTDREVLEDTHRVFGRYYQRVPAVTLEGLQSVIDDMALSVPRLTGTTADALVDVRLLREIESSGFVEKLYR